MGQVWSVYNLVPLLLSSLCFMSSDGNVISLLPAPAAMSAARCHVPIKMDSYPFGAVNLNSFIHKSLLDTVLYHSNRKVMRRESAVNVSPPLPVAECFMASRQ